MRENAWGAVNKEGGEEEGTKGTKGGRARGSKESERGS